jgi:hypothetical protein
MLSGNPDLAGKPESVDILLPQPQEPEALLNTIAELLARQRLRAKGHRRPSREQKAHRLSKWWADRFS